MSYITDPSSQLARANKQPFENIQFELRIPHKDGALSVGVDTPTGADVAVGTAAVDWDGAATNVRIWLPLVLDKVILPNRKEGPKLHAVGPFSGIVARASFNESFYRPAVTDNGELFALEHTIFDRNDCFRAVALDGLFRAVVGKVLQRRTSDKQAS